MLFRETGTTILVDAFALAGRLELNTHRGRGRDGREEVADLEAGELHGGLETLLELLVGQLYD